MKPPNNQPALEKSKNDVLNSRPKFETFQTEYNAGIKSKMFNHSVDENLINNTLGINVNPQMVAIPCLPINMRNGVVVRGTGTPFDKSGYNMTPLSWKNKLSFTPDRFGATSDFSQKDHLAINSYVR